MACKGFEGKFPPISILDMDQLIGVKVELGDDGGAMKPHNHRMDEETTRQPSLCTCSHSIPLAPWWGLTSHGLKHARMVWMAGRGRSGGTMPPTPRWLQQADQFTSCDDKAKDSPQSAGDKVMKEGKTGWFPGTCPTGYGMHSFTQ